MQLAKTPWTVAEPRSRSTRRLWHGTRPEIALTILNGDRQLVPGPRRQADGKLPQNLDKTYVAENPGLAAQYAAPPS